MGYALWIVMIVGGTVLPALATGLSNVENEAFRLIIPAVIGFGVSSLINTQMARPHVAAYRRERGK